MEPLIQALKDRRVAFAVAGAAVALAAGLLVAFGLMRKHKGDDNLPPPAAQAGLIVETGSPNEGKLDPQAKLRCFVAGRFVGEATLAECARQNGVATDALDVGMDESGALAAAQDAGATLVPLPPPDAEAATQEEPAAVQPTGAPGAPAAGPTGPCLRYAGAEWRRTGPDVTLNACVQALFAGHCERPGGASYGRWTSQTLRLVPGRVEISSDNRNFRPLADQSPTCAVAPTE